MDTELSEARNVLNVAEYHMIFAIEEIDRNDFTKAQQLLEEAVKRIRTFSEKYRKPWSSAHPKGK